MLYNQLSDMIKVRFKSVTTTYEIRATYDKNTITVYQAYREEIALPALKAGRFVAPFSFNRMTWIKPSFLWMMERSNWGLKSDQECVLAIRIKRTSWEEALTQAVLTGYESKVYKDYEDWQKQFENAKVYVQWDPERTLRGKSLPYKSIQVGLSLHIIEMYVNDWIVEIQDYRPVVKKIHTIINAGQMNKVSQFLPKEKVYPTSDIIVRRLGMNI